MANSSKIRNNGATIGYESELWLMADALRGSMDAAEYKHVVLGLIFLKYISDAFEEQHARLVSEKDQGADPEDPDEYRAVNVFWVPQAGSIGVGVSLLTYDGRVHFGLMADRNAIAAPREITRAFVAEFERLLLRIVAGSPLQAV